MAILGFVILMGLIVSLGVVIAEVTTERDALYLENMRLKSQNEILLEQVKQLEGK